MSETQDSAKTYFDQGVPVVAVKQKKPLVEWAHWQTKPQTAEEFEALPWSEADGFAVICGTKLNNGLYAGAVDFDVKNVSEEAQEKGQQILKKMLCTQMEQTPSGGQHWVYHCNAKPRTISVYHNEYALEILGEGKLCIMAPSRGYRRLNDNTPAVVNDLEDSMLQAIWKAGFKPEKTKAGAWFDREDLTGKRFSGKTPPCIEALYRGVKEGERNEYAIRLASFLANFRRLRADHVQEQMRKINKLNDPALDENELQAIVKSAVNGGYVYGCTDPILKKHCNRNECPIASKSIAKMLSKEELERAENLLNSYKLLDYVLSYGKRRLIGEDNVILANFVMFCSGQTRYPISGVISGFSGSGKNESIRAIKPLLPEEWLFEFTTSTPEAIKYLPEEFAGTLVIYEASGVRGDSGSLSLRAIGEGESIETIYPMRNELTGRMEMGRAKTNAKNFITTSSDIDINPDLYRRVLKHTMDHSTQLTKRVIAKKLRDSSYPDSLKTKLGLQNPLPCKEEDFRNALRLLDWKVEVIIFPPSQLLNILDLAVKREQEVALRTLIEKVVNFAKVIAILNQKKRLHVKIDDLEYVIADPEDLLEALTILKASITETVSRIEKRQEEVLRLFTNTDVSLNKHDVASKLKVSTRTSAKALRTLASAGYLKEEKSGKAYDYKLLQKEPEYLDLLENARSFRLFQQNSLKQWLDTIVHSCTAKGTPLGFRFGQDDSWSTVPPSITLETQTESSLEPPPTLLISKVQECTNPSAAEPSLDRQTSQNHLAFSTMSRICGSKPENNHNNAPVTLDDFRSVYWSDGSYGWHPCAVCGQTKLTSWQAETFRDEKLWLCEDCKCEWEKRRENI